MIKDANHKATNRIFIQTMQIINHILLSFIGILFISASSWAQTAPKYSNEFLSIGVGARSFAMANSTIASVNDESAVYWNQANLVKLKNPVTVGLMHAEYFAGLSQYDFGAIAFKLDDVSALGISFIRFGVDNIPNTLQLVDVNGNLRFDRIKAFSIADYAVSFSYGRKLAIEGLSVGGNAKIVRRVAGQFASSWGFGIDLSGYYALKQWQFAAVFRDITTTFNAWSFNNTELEEVFELTGNVLPTNHTELTLPKFIFGAAYSYAIGERFGVLGEVNMDVSTDGKRNVLIKTNTISIDPHLGVEFDYKQLVFLRAGIGNIQQEPDFDKGTITTLQPNLGLGIKYLRFKIDYALTDIGNVSAAGYSHVFSLSYSIKKQNTK